MKGLIVECISNLFKIECTKNSKKEIYDAYARGRLKKDDITPVVGDWVIFEITDLENKKAVINEILERKSYIKRPKMANMTQIVFVVSSKDPKPDLLMLDKQLAYSEYLGINAIIVLNKIDLDKDNEFKEIKKVYEKIGYPVIETNAKKKIGISSLKDLLEGNINGFSGNSGVGKSSLINAIFDDDITKEGEISKKNRRGKNTTTQVKLYEIGKNTYIADTPGFSTFDISEIESKNLASYYKEFRKYINDCEFIGCSHIKEENCGIKKAVREGKIDSKRYERFTKIYEELKKKEEKKW